VNVIPPFVTANPLIGCAATSSIVRVTVVAIAVETQANTRSSLFIIATILLLYFVDKNMGI
jgi:hypothetical protein